MSSGVLDKVLSSPKLPSLPAIALEVIDLVQDPDVSLKQIAETIQHDPAMAGKILKTVNSSFYGQPKRITTITNALVVLGLNSVKTLALGFSLVSQMKDADVEGFDHTNYWLRCVTCSAASKTLCEKSGKGEPEEAFLGALLQDLGMLAMNAALEAEYNAVYKESKKIHRDLGPLEREAFEVDHAEVGAALAEKWRLPGILIDCIKFHERPTSCKSDSLHLVRCVALGAQIAEMMDPTQNTDPEQTNKMATRANQWLGINPCEFEMLIETVAERAREVQKLLEVPCVVADASEIMGRAAETLQNITLQTAMEAQQLEKQNQELSEAATRDPLTGASNRKAFDDFMIEQFEKTKQGGGPLSILFSDTDHFKNFNDTHGHQVGDKVLVEQSKLLQSLCPEGGMVSRYGGEEFAIVLPNVDRRAATVYAEKIRKAVELLDTVKDTTGKPLTITNSIGVATYEGVLFKSHAQLVLAADKAVYAAKGAGRNCVRVFAPKVKPKAA